MRKNIINAIVASIIVALITAVFSFSIRGYLNWFDVVNSIIGTFIIWAVFIPMVNRHWSARQIE